MTDTHTTADPEPTEPVRDELWRHLDWSFWGTGMADVFREPLAEAMLSGITPEQRAQANDLITRWRDHREFVGRDTYEAQKAEIESLRAQLAEQPNEVLPPWEAVYDSATFTSRLLGYCTDEIAAKGAAEAWLRAQVEDATGLTWLPDPQMAVGEWDQWFELVRDNPHGDGVVSTEIVVRRRAARTTTTQEN